MKVAVYTIALNEAANAERWANSAVDADYRIVADTGSTDDTVERLTVAGVTVHKIAIRPWRFDDARNAAMALLPADVDVCCTMDMDRFLEPGWRAKLEAAWTSETTALYCQTVYKASVDDPTPLRSWPAKNFHHRWGYRFKRPVHEALVFTGEREVTANSSDIVMFEVQDLAKPTRSSYLPLMEVAHREDPDDAQICFWLGRDLMWANQHERAVPLLERYLALPTSKWAEERSEAMRYLARILPEQRLSWLDKARTEAPHRREIWLDLAEEFHGKADWLNLFWACTNGIEKTHRTGSYLDDANCWGFRLFDLGAIASWHLNAMDRAVEWGQNALDLDPRNERLNNNLSFFRNLRAELAGQLTAPGPLREVGPNGVTVSTTIDGKEIKFFVTNKDDEIMQFHYNGEFYEKEDLEIIKRYFDNNSKAFVDIGANVGNHTIFASKILEAKRVIPIEPNIVAFEILKRNVIINRCSNVDTSFLGIALSDEVSRLRKSTPHSNNIGHTIYSVDASGETSAAIGDELLSGESVGFIKLDVEGMEINILSGLRLTIENCRPVIFVEIWDRRLHDFIEWCEKASYLVVEEYKRYTVIKNYLVRPIEKIAAEAKAGSLEHEFCSLLEGKVSGDAASWRQLAQRYRDSGRGLQAAVMFCRWARMTTSDEERWYARWQMANCLHVDDEDQFVKRTLEAFRARPYRAEPLYTLARHYLRQSRGDIAVEYAEAGLCLGIPESDSVGVEAEIYLTGLKETFTIAATYSNDPAQKERGRRVCNWLSMDPAIPASVRNLSRFNYKWYTERADRYFPSIFFHELLVIAPEGYKPGNVSVARDGAGFVILVRAVNYDHLESGYFDRHGDTSFRQRTLLLRLDERFNVTSSSEVLAPEDMPQPLHLDSLGFEDPRPVVWRNQLWCLSSVRQLNTEGRAEMVLARIDATSASEYVLSDWQVLPSGTSPQWEKNWMPQVLGDDLRFIYSVDPTRIITERGETVFEEKAAIAAENFRGGTQTIPFDDGWLMLIHEWELSGSRRNYFHRFIWLDANHRLARLTLRFFLKRVASEFAAGLAWNVAGTHLIISFGTDDREPALAIVSADEVRSALLEVESHRCASDQVCEASRSKWKAIVQNG